MFTDLAVIDWIALVFAAILLAAATAAAIIAYITSTRRPKRTVRANGRPVHAMSPRIGRATTPSQAPGATIAMTKTHASPAKPQEASPPDTRGHGRHALDPDAEVAARAAKLRRAPVAEERGPDVKSSGFAMIVDRTPAHAKALGPDSKDVATSAAISNYDTVEGFKARNPGFFDDPMGRHELRYWDGHTWTEYVKEHGERFTDPL